MKILGTPKKERKVKKLITIIGLGAMLLGAGPANAGDQWSMPGRPTVCDMPAGPSLDKCRAGVTSLMRPDQPGASCCGEADAFITDNFVPIEDGGGDLWAIIGADYPDTPGIVQDDGAISAGTRGLKKGDRILVPHAKINTDQSETWSSGHGVIFLRPSDREVLCYRYPPLT